MESSFDIPNWCTTDRRNFDESGKPAFAQTINKKKKIGFSIAPLTDSSPAPFTTSSQLSSTSSDFNIKL